MARRGTAPPGEPILGVNDFGSSGRTAAQVLGDLTTILGKLKQNNAATKTILFTIPTFNWSGAEPSRTPSSPGSESDARRAKGWEFHG